ncbi:MAG: hypothetical protein R3E53_04115 [Myxococcota bacterium]
MIVGRMNLSSCLRKADVPGEALLAQLPERVDLVHLRDAEAAPHSFGMKPCVLLEDEHRVVVSASSLLSDRPGCRPSCRASTSPTNVPRRAAGDRSKYFSSPSKTIPPLPSAVMMWKIEKLVIETSARVAVYRRSLPHEVSAVVDHEEATPIGDLTHDVPVADAADEVGDQDRPRLRARRVLDLVDLDLVREADVDEDRAVDSRSPRRPRR